MSDKGKRERDGLPSGVLQCSIRYFCCGALLVFVGTILLCVFGFMIVLPYTETVTWPLATCQVIGASYNSYICSCDRQASHNDPSTSQSYSITQRDKSKENQVNLHTESNRCLKQHPCLQVRVRLRREEEQTGVNGSTEVQHTANLYRSWSDAFYNTCALHECGDEQWNVQEVRRFRLQWGQSNSTYPCYHNPDNNDQAIIQRITCEQVIHAVLWPSLALVTGTLIWLGLCLGCWTVELDHKTQQPTIDRSGTLL